MSLKTRFLTLHASLSTIAFNDKWNNGTGYLDHITDDFDFNLPEGEMVASTSPAPNSRRIIILGLSHNFKAVIFERFTDGTGSPFVLVSNTPSRFSTKHIVEGIAIPDLGSTALTEEHFDNFLEFKNKELLVLTEDGIEYLNKNVDLVISKTNDFEKLIEDCYVGVKQDDLMAFGFNIQELHEKGYIKDIV